MEFTPLFSNNIRFIDMKLISPKVSPNTDGCDPESCENVDIIGVHFQLVMIASRLNQVRFIWEESIKSRHLISILEIAQ